ncbi:hypothetical protein [Halosimplex carlsbadense]|uniref:hypothetical protein n=1 Tax=Halosimplex carlsbadense TaxID=171164 RepID=UPI001267A03B|nr:hypothetical protein [Halosimplex carlsbadense]
MNTRILLLVVAGSVAISGCPAGNSDGSINFSGELKATESQFALDAAVVNTGYADTVYRNVSVSLFTTNGTVIESVSIGELRRSTDVSMMSNRIPEYVIRHSPDFWTDGNIDVSYYEFVRDSQAPDGIYTERSVSNETDFPVVVPAATE